MRHMDRTKYLYPSKTRIATLLMTLVMLSFGSKVAAQAPEPTLTANPSFDNSTIYYLYNIEAKAFIIGANDWGTQASLSKEYGYQFKLESVGNGEIRLSNRANNSNDWKYLFLDTDEINLFLDYNNNGYYGHWKAIKNGDTDRYTITYTSQESKNIRWRGDWSNTRLYFEAGSTGNEWGFVTPEDYKIYQGKYKAYLGQINKPAPKRGDIVFFEEASTNATDGWTIDALPDGHNFQVNTWSNEGNDDGTNMTTPFVEYWRIYSGNLNNATLSRNLTGFQPGTYTVSLKVRAYKERSTEIPDGSTVTFTANGVSYPFSGTTKSYDDSNNDRDYAWRYEEYSVPVTVGTDGKIDLSITLNGAKFNWISLKDLEITFTNYTSFEHYKGIVSEMGTPPEGFKVDFKTSADDPRLASGVTLQRAHEYTHDIYVLPGQTYTLEPFSDFHTHATNNGYMQQYIRWYDYRTDATSDRLGQYHDNRGYEIAGKGYFGSTLISGNQNDAASCIYTAPTNSDESILDIIAIDVSCDATPLKVDKENNYALVEPTLQYRHIFVIHNAKQLADEISGSKTSNENYVNNHRIKLMCPEGTPFQYRLDNYEYRGFGNDSKPTGLYYKTSGGNYENVYHYRVETLVKNGNDYEVLGSTIYNKSLDQNGNGFHTLNTTQYKKEQGQNNNNAVVVTPNAIGEYVVNVPAKQNGGQAWDSQFWIKLDAPLANGSVYHLKFKYKASVNANVETQCHKGNPGDDNNYLHYACIGSPAFETEWKTYEGDYTVPNECGDNFQSIAFNLTQNDNNVIYYFKDIEIRYPISGDNIGATGKKLDTDNESDETAVCNNMESVAFNGNNYSLAYTYKCIEGYDRAIYIKKPVVGEYLIRIYAIDSNNGSSYTDIKTANGETNLLLMEYELEVLPSSKASLLTEAQLAQEQYAHQRPKSLENAYGEPTTEVNFDNVKASECSLDGSSDGYYKWPWLWESSSYGFGYSEQYDYNMYRIANRSSKVPYKINNDIRDRLYADTNGNEKGFFYYANAASDPSRMAILNIGNDLCTNTRVYVSAWVNEFNNNRETANIVFSFIGVAADGTETILSSYVSGYVFGGQNSPSGFNYNNGRDQGANYIYEDKDPTHNPDQRGQWMHIYYSFVPNVPADATFDHYIISLENNCTSSNGADYAIDDIRCFVCHPTVFAHQVQPVCNGSKQTELKFTADFDHLLQAFDLTEASDEAHGVDKSFHYCFIDKYKFEEELETRKESDGTYPDNAYEEAFNAALVKGTYGTGEGTSPNYGTFTFNTYFAKESNKGVAYSTLRTVSFEGIYITDNDMKVNGKYIIAMVDAAIYPTPTYEHFNIMDKCSYTSEFTIIASSVIKIDGRISSDLDGASICANQRPNISLDLNGISRSDGSIYNQEDARFDWFYGSIDDYNKAKYESQSLSTAIVEFRFEYPSVSQEDFANKDPKGEYTQDMKDCITYFLDNNSLKLFQKSTIVSIMDQFHGLGEGGTQDYYITVIPINPTPENTEIEYCLDAFQIHINLSTRNPQMKDGDDQGKIPYPTAMRDVPIRIGLTQLSKCRINEINTDFGNSITTLLVPLREVQPVTKNASKLVKDSSNDYIYLAASDDPALDPESEDYDENSGAIDIEDSEGNKLSGLKCIGRLKEITAIFAGRNPGTNYCKLAFLKNFKFREGYSYTIKFHFLEASEEDDGDMIIEGDICPGDIVMTIKVVPEYQMWTGEVSRNWNDDRNWRRVTRTELFNPTTTEVGNDFVTDGGTNDNTKAFVPADYTKVIIPTNPEGGRIPYLYDLRQNSNLDGVTYAGIPSVSNYIKSMASGNDAIADVPPTTYGTGTDAQDADISYEMSSIDLASGDVACRSWYDHTCEQIHFMSGAELMDQQYLHYQKAWADIDMPAGEWNSVALPITNVVAGDFYLPTNGARQDTPLFQNITFNTEIHDRFRPAVYQRTWNAGQAKVVHLTEDDTNAATNMDWSHVYNDVNVRYNSGKGLSVKPDISMLPDASKPADGIVKFRFPKADTEYTYYNLEHNDGGNARKTERINSEDLNQQGSRIGKLATFNGSGEYYSLVGDSTETADDMQYFLIGNPFVCHINMNEFFNQNTNLAKKYWIETANGQRTAITDDNNEWISTIDDATTISPGQSFFVKLADGQTATKKIYPKFTPSMMIYTDSNGNSTNDPTKTSKKRMYITASSGNRQNVAMLTDAQTSQHNGAELLIDADLYDDIYVYASMKGQAMSIAQIGQGDTIPIGLAGKADNTIITIKGADTFGFDLYLIDSELGTTTLIDSDLTLDANTNGIRYYICSKAKGKRQDTAADYNDLPRLTVSASTITAFAPQSEPINNMSIYSANGMLIESFSIDSAQQKSSTILATGTYLVKIVTPSYEHTYKLLVK